MDSGPSDGRERRHSGSEETRGEDRRGEDRRGEDRRGEERRGEERRGEERKEIRKEKKENKEIIHDCHGAATQGSCVKN
jgi:hypothetical protein